VAGCATFAVACETTEETSYDQYNAEDDTVTITIGGEELLAPVETVLHSSTGEIEVGVASVDPGGGPVGTKHAVIVEVYSDYANDIDRVSVRTDSGKDRGEDEFDLDADSASEGLWKIEIVSAGEDGESREDTLTFRLWQAAEE
jgi:hypothetical protein